MRLRALFLWQKEKACAQISSRSAEHSVSNFALNINAIHGDAAEEFGIEVGGFLGHDFPGGGDAHDLIDVDRIEEESNLGGTAVDGVEGGGGLAFVAEVALGGDGLRCDAESRFEDSVVEEDDI
jgi:hypothetical protein